MKKFLIVLVFCLVSWNSVIANSISPVPTLQPFTPTATTTPTFTATPTQVQVTLLPLPSPTATIFPEKTCIHLIGLGCKQYLPLIRNKFSSGE